MLLYLVTVPWTDEFRRFLQAAPVLLRVVAWLDLSARVSAMRSTASMASYQAVVREELTTPFPAATLERAQVVFRAAPEGRRHARWTL